MVLVCVYAIMSDEGIFRLKIEMYQLPRTSLEWPSPRLPSGQASSGQISARRHACDQPSVMAPWTRAVSCGQAPCDRADSTEWTTECAGAPAQHSGLGPVGRQTRSHSEAALLPPVPLVCYEAVPFLQDAVSDSSATQQPRLDVKILTPVLYGTFPELIHGVCS